MIERIDGFIVPEVYGITFVPVSEERTWPEN